LDGHGSAKLLKVTNFELCDEAASAAKRQKTEPDDGGLKFKNDVDTDSRPYVHDPGAAQNIPSSVGGPFDSAAPTANQQQPGPTRVSSGIGHPEVAKPAPPKTESGGSQRGMEIETWLKSLDSNNDELLKYLPSLRQEFTSLDQLVASYSPPSEGSNKPLLQCIEPAIFEAIGVNQLGHKLLLAKGIVALGASIQ